MWESSRESRKLAGKERRQPMSDIVLAITGASGALYAVRLLEVLLSAGRAVHLVMSPSATQVFQKELGLTVDLDRFSPSQLVRSDRPNHPRAVLSQLHLTSSAQGLSFAAQDSAAKIGRLEYHRFSDFAAGIASGSFLTSGMVI